MWSADTEMKPRAVDDARGDRHTQPAWHQRMTAAGARQARLGPGFATAAALLTGGAQQHRDRHHGAPTGLSGRETDFSLDRLTAIADGVREE